MACITKPLFRLAVIGGLTAGGVFLLAQTPRGGAMYSQIKTKITNTIDSAIDDPVALRAQLRSLERQYPERIAKVRGELAELSEQAQRVERDRQIALKVVEMASADLDTITDRLDQARSAREESPGAVIRVRFEDRTLSVEESYNRATQIRNTVSAYTTRASEAERSMQVLDQQSERLTDLLNELEKEHTAFQTQLAQLDGQIEVIARNEKLIDMVEQREQAIRNLDKFETVSLDQVSGRMAKIQAEQEARLTSLLSGAERRSYEDMAEQELSREQSARQLFESTMELPLSLPSETIEIGDDGEVKRGEERRGPVASRESVIIE
jgi:chromosome segregation ATPase